MDKVGLSEAIRTALTTNGVDASTEKVKHYIITNYPELVPKLETSTFGSTLSNQRKKLREENTAQDEADSPTDVIDDTSNPVVEMLITLKALITANGKENLKKLIDAL